MTRPRTMSRRPPVRLRPSDLARTQRPAAPADRLPAAARVGEVRPGWLVRRPGLAIDRHRSTMAHLASLYPFHADAGLGSRGPYMGVNVTAGDAGFWYDPFELYGTVLTNPNLIVMGTVGSGKSATVKAWLRRERAVYGPRRWLAIIDPKGEYHTLADDLGLTVVKLYPGGQHRLNPMDPRTGIDGTDDLIARQDLAVALVAGVLGRRLDPTEDAVLGWAVEELCRTGRPFTLTDLIGKIQAPADDLVRMARRSPLDLARATSPVTFALDRLCTRTLRGMFDGPTNVNINWHDNPGVVLDLSAVFQNTAALPLVMLSAISWLSAILRQDSDVRVLQVIDEAWAAVRHGAGYFQASLKLSRAYGVSTCVVCHRPADLTAQADDGTADAKIAAGLLSDIQTRVLLRQPSELLDDAAALFELSPRERGWLGQLVRGRALWKMQGYTAVVQQVLTPTETALFQTDTAMSA